MLVGGQGDGGLAAAISNGEHCACVCVHPLITRFIKTRRACQSASASPPGGTARALSIGAQMNPRPGDMTHVLCSMSSSYAQCIKRRKLCFLSMPRPRRRAHECRGLALWYRCAASAQVVDYIYSYAVQSEKSGDPSIVCRNATVMLALANFKTRVYTPRTVHVCLSQDARYRGRTAIV